MKEGCAVLCWAAFPGQAGVQPRKMQLVQTLVMRTQHGPRTQQMRVLCGGCLWP